MPQGGVMSLRSGIAESEIKIEITVSRKVIAAGLGNFVYG